MNKYSMAKQKTLSELCVKKDSEIIELEQKLSESIPKAKLVETIKDIQEEVVEKIDSTRWGWDGDCGVSSEVGTYFDDLLQAIEEL